MYNCLSKNPNPMLGQAYNDRTMVSEISSGVYDVDANTRMGIFDLIDPVILVVNLVLGCTFCATFIINDMYKNPFMVNPVKSFLIKNGFCVQEWILTLTLLSATIVIGNIPVIIFMFVDAKYELYCIIAHVLFNVLLEEYFKTFYYYKYVMPLAECLIKFTVRPIVFSNIFCALCMHYAAWDYPLLHLLHNFVVVFASRNNFFFDEIVSLMGTAYVLYLLVRSGPYQMRLVNFLIVKSKKVFSLRVQYGLQFVFYALIEELCKQFFYVSIALPLAECVARVYKQRTIKYCILPMFIHYLSYRYSFVIHLVYNFVAILYEFPTATYKDVLLSEAPVKKLEPVEAIIYVDLPTSFPSIEKKRPPIFGSISFADYKELYSFILCRPTLQSGFEDYEELARLSCGKIMNRAESLPLTEMMSSLKEMNLTDHLPQIYALLQFVADLAYISFLNSKLSSFKSLLYPIMNALQHAYASFYELTPYEAFHKIYNKSKTLIVEYLEGYSLQGISDHAGHLDDFISDSENLLSGKFANMIKDLVLVVLGLPVMYESSKELKPYVGKIEKTSVLDVFKSVVRTLQFTCKAIVLVDKKGLPLSAVLAGNTNFYAIGAEINQLLVRRVTVGPSDDPEVYSLNKYTSILDKCKLALEVLPSTKEDVKYVNEIKTRIILAENKAAALNLEKRIPPIGFVLTGPSGIGKGTLINLFTKICCEVLDIEYHPSQCYSKNRNEDFFSGYAGQAVFRMPEVGSLKDVIVKSQGDPGLEAILCMSDSNAYATEQAEAEKKGNVFFTSSMLIVDTNSPNMNAEHCVNNPAAVWRRFYYVEAVVKQEYTKKVRKEIDGVIHIRDTMELDPTIPAPEGQFFNKWHFRVYARRAVTKRDFEVEEIFKTSEITEFYSKITRLTKDYYALQRNVLATSAKEVGLLGQLPARESTLEDFLDMPEFYDEPVELQRDENGEFVDPLEPEYKLEGPIEYLKSKCLPRGLDTVCETVLPKNDAAFVKLLKTVADQGMNPFFIDQVKKAADRREISREEMKKLLDHIILSMIDNHDDDAGYETAEDDCIEFDNSILFNAVEEFEVVSKSIYTSVIPKTLLAFAGCYGIFRFLSSALSFVQSLSPVIKEEMYSPPVHSLDENLQYMKQIELNAGCSPELYIGARKARDDFDEQGRVAKYMRYDFRDPLVSHTDQSNSTILQSVCKNMRNFFVVSKTPSRFTKYGKFYQDSQMGRGVGLKGSLFVTNAHIIVKLLDDSDEYRKTGTCTLMFTIASNVTHVVSIDNDNLIFHPEKDICFIKHPKFQFRDVTSIMTNNLQVASPGVLIDASKEDACIPCHIGSELDKPIKLNNTFVNKISKFHQDGIVYYKVGVRPITFKGFSTYEGLCGSPYIQNRSGTFFFAGLHTIGSSFGEGFLTEVLLKDIPEEVTFREEFSLPAVFPIPIDVHNSTTSFSMPSAPKSFIVCGATEEKVPVMHPTAYMNKEIINTLITSLDVDDFVIEKAGKKLYKLQTPIFKAYKNSEGVLKHPHEVWLSKFEPRGCLKAGFFEKFSTEFVNIFVNKCKKNGICFQPLPLIQAINGTMDSYCRRMKSSTAAGPMFKGGKAKYMPLSSHSNISDLVEEYNKYYSLTDTDRIATNDLLEEVNRLYTCYLSGELGVPIHKASLKDEVRSVDKIDKHSIRHFFVCSLEFLIVSRQFLKPLYVYMNNYNNLFYTALGVDPLSPEWKDMFSKFEDRIFDAGDIGGFDINTCEEISIIANRLAISLLKEAGYNDFALRISSGILRELLHPHIMLEGVLVYFPFLTISGGDGTTEYNCLKNLVLQCVCFSMMCTPLGKTYYPDINITSEYSLEYFLEHCQLALLGDDSLNIKDEKLSFYTFEVHQTAMSEIGMEYTSPRKTTEGGDCNIWEAEFLKRKSKVHPDFGFVACLDKHALIKMLGYGIQTSISREEQLREKFIAFAWELAPHYEEARWSAILEQVGSVIASQLGMSYIELKQSLPTWNRIKERILGLSISSESNPLSSLEKYEDTL